MSKVIRFSKTMERVGLRTTSIYEQIAAGKFPQPIKLGNRAIGFLESEIDEWIASRPRAVITTKPSRQRATPEADQSSRISGSPSKKVRASEAA